MNRKVAAILVVMAIIFVSLFWYFYFYKAGHCEISGALCFCWDGGCGCEASHCYAKVASQISSQSDLKPTDCNRIFHLFRHSDNQYLSCIIKAAQVQKNLDICFVDDNLLNNLYYGPNTYPIRMPQACIKEYAINSGDPELCFYKNAFSGDGDPTNFYNCYTQAGGTLTSQICNRIADSWEKSCCESKLMNSTRGC